MMTKRVKLTQPAASASIDGGSFCRRTALGLLAGLMLLLGTPGCATFDPVTGQRSRNLYSLQDEVGLGHQLHGDLMASLAVQGVAINQDANRVAQLQTMVERIGAVSHIPDFPFQATLVHTNAANALATPGGHVVIFEGLYRGANRVVENENELAAVVAHEIAHMTCRHATEAMTRALPIELALMGAAIFAESRDRDRIRSILGGTMLVYQGLVVTAYSRRDEEEADRIGMEYMARAGYDPAAVVRLWERVSSQRAPDPAVMTYLSTHPSAAVRHRNLAHQLPAMQAIYERTQHGPPEPIVGPRHTGP